MDLLWGPRAPGRTYAFLTYASFSPLRDYDPHGPVGPTAFWKMMDGLQGTDVHVSRHEFLRIIDDDGDTYSDGLSWLEADEAVNPEVPAGGEGGGVGADADEIGPGVDMDEMETVEEVLTGA